MNSANILAVEDGREINRLVSKTLSNEGYMIDSVLNGFEALEYFKSKCYHVVVLNLMIHYIPGIKFGILNPRK